jgi:hypothetical protein
LNAEPLCFEQKQTPAVKTTTKKVLYNKNGIYQGDLEIAGKK